MRVKLRSVRARFTLWYATALIVIILLFSSGIYFFARYSLMRQADEQLVRHVATLKGVLLENPAEIIEIMEYGYVGIFRIMDGDTSFAVTTTWLDSGLDKAREAAIAASPRSLAAPDGRSYRLLTVPLDKPGHSYRISVAIDEGQMRRFLDSLMTIMLFGIPAAVALAVIGGYLLAGRVLAPVSAITGKASEITAERLSERLPVETPDDEFGRLATVFNETFARLEDAFERMRRFTADASHELRTPLTAIKSVGEVGLQEGGDAAACREVIGSMLEEADRLARLVDSLLTLSRADSGMMPLEREPTDLTALAADVIDCLGVLAEEKEQSLILDAGEPVTAEIDRTTLRQALINLVDNAIKFTPRKGHIRVAVKLATAEEAVIEVSDDGPGIAKEHQARIFDRFYRVDKGRSREMGGAGLGLAITRWAVEVNNGRIMLESEEGRGSTFRIVLPPPLIDEDK